MTSLRNIGIIYKVELELVRMGTFLLATPTTSCNLELNPSGSESGLEECEGGGNETPTEIRW